MNQKRSPYLGLWSGGRGAERNPGNYHRRDDGSHIYTSGDYFEWWYFDAAFDNGYHAVVTYHYMNGFRKPIIPTIQVMIYRSDGAKFVRFRNCDRNNLIYAGPEYCDVRMENSWVRDTGDGYELYMEIDGVGAHLTFRNIVPPWKAGTGLFFNDEENRLVSGWVVPVPNGVVEGELILDHESMLVKGTGYHDHNWGNRRMYEFSEGWYWGRINNDQYTIAYGWVMPREEGAPVMSPFLVGRPNEIVLSTDRIVARLQDLVTDQVSGRSYARKLSFTSDAGNVKLMLNIDVKRVLETIQLEKVADWNQYYFRFIADYEMNISIDGREDRISGEMLNEYMAL